MHKTCLPKAFIQPLPRMRQKTSKIKLSQTPGLQACIWVDSQTWGTIARVILNVPFVFRNIKPFFLISISASYSHTAKGWWLDFTFWDHCALDEWSVSDSFPLLHDSLDLLLTKLCKITRLAVLCEACRDAAKPFYDLKWCQGTVTARQLLLTVCADHMCRNMQSKIMKRERDFTSRQGFTFP